MGSPFYTDLREERVYPPADPGMGWQPCDCDEINPSDRPCWVCEVQAERLAAEKVRRG